MRWKVVRPITAIVSVLLLVATPMHADPVVMSDVTTIIGSYQNSLDLRLTSFSQDGTTATGASNSILSGVAVRSDDPQNGVHTIPQGDVEATICDCGEILLAGGAFPKWPLLFLAAVPLFFIPGHEDIVPPITPPPPPGIVTPPSAPIPEPASLLLFGSGLAAFGAALRRRYAGMKRAARVDPTDES